MKAKDVEVIHLILLCGVGKILSGIWDHFVSDFVSYNLTDVQFYVSKF